jgi:transcriptional regulator with XRE-family HTH domain
MPRSRRSPRYAALCASVTEARLAAGLTQADLARELRRPQSFVSKVESGERRLDVVEFLEVARALGCDATAIVTALLAIER